MFQYLNDKDVVVVFTCEDCNEFIEVYIPELIECGTPICPFCDTETIHLSTKLIV